MAGSKRRRGVVVTDRDMEILRALPIARILDSEDVQAVGPFTTPRRANRRLFQLWLAGLLTKFWVGTQAGGRKAVYGLSKKGAALVGEEEYRLIPRREGELVVGDGFVEHQLALNSIMIRARFGALPDGYRCEHWAAFKLPLSLSVPLVPDGYFEIQSSHEVLSMFCELDRGTESQKIWTKKVGLYLKLAISGEFQQLFRHDRFRVLVVVPSVKRLQSIRRTIAKQTNKIFWLSTLSDINREGLWSPIWIRPAGDSKLSLL